MDDVQVIASLIETIGSVGTTVGLMLLWLKDKNDTLSKERTSRSELSKLIVDDWHELTKIRNPAKTDEK